MSDGKIYITISDTRTGEVLGGTNIQVPKEPKQKSNENALKDFAKHQFFNLIESEAKQMVNYSLSNIGNFTGDYNAQREVNFGLAKASGAMSLYLAAKAGGVMFGPVGAAISVATMVAAQTVNFGLQLHSHNIEIKKQNYSISQLRQLSGLDGLTNGSRI